ncbi:MAG: RNA 2'-phosphotransferase [Gammaproteobacteria bacterium]|nr:RNA 2'-phosphotransferase [Gammaproteobacteria bacterium]
MDYNKLSKIISYALRHDPLLFEIEMDDEGWVDAEKLLETIRREKSEWSDITQLDLIFMIKNSEKKRHEYNNKRIRALYGHSTPQKLKKISSIPPEILYHGTSSGAATKISKNGLFPMGRQYVHLSVDIVTAIQVGKRKSRNPVIFEVTALLAHNKGIKFYKGNDKVWLADEIPPEYISKTSL